MGAQVHVVKGRQRVAAEAQSALGDYLQCAAQSASKGALAARQVAVCVGWTEEQLVTIPVREERGVSSGRE